MTTNLAKAIEPRAELYVELAHVPAINFAIEHAGVPVITEVRISNTGTLASSPLELTVRIEPDLAERQTHLVGVVRPGEPVELPPLDLRLRPGRLRKVVEAERAELEWELRDASTVIASGRRAIEVLAYNEWPGLRAPPALLACFVTPNAPSVATVLKLVHERLRERSGNGSIDGYQSRSSARAREMVRALYESIQALGIAYIGVPASYEEVGQKIRLLDTVLRDRHGTCIDLTLLVASCLEQMSISPLIVLERGHAYPGAWLEDERFHEGVVYDAARLRNTHALGQVTFFDASAMVNEPRVPFEVAERVAREALDANAQFVCALDVAAARRDRYRPMPLRDDEAIQSSHQQGTDSGLGQAPVPFAAPANDFSRRAPVSAPPSGQAAKPTALNERFRIWREKLLDLSLRNKLLNFRLDTKSALELDVPNIARLEDLLANDSTFQVHPRTRDPRDRRDEKLVRAHGGDDARRAGLLTDLDKLILHTPLDETGLSKQAIQVKRAAREAIEDGGANVLYLALGLLKWFESDSSETERLAPLLLMPVTIEYARDTRKVQLRRLAEETLPNWTLVEKMRADFGVDLDSLTAIEADESGADVPAMLRAVRERLVRMPRWEVLEQAHVGVFSFTKYLMWRDLGDNQAVLLENRVIRNIANKSTEGFAPTGRSIVPERIDYETSPEEFPLVVDSDSTQTAAVINAVRGRSFVLQGPPGTGKSQTITNLIAAALAGGKTVLFVSEKMAALEVVYRRLQSVGLGDFCLELHSHKAQKREVIQSLGHTLERAERTKNTSWVEESAELAKMRDQLNSYVRALHEPTAMGETFHQVSGRLLALVDAPAIRLVRPGAASMTRDELQRALKAASDFGLAATQVEPVSAAPFRDCQVVGWSGQRERETGDALEHACSALDQLEVARNGLCTAFEIDQSLSLRKLTDVAQLIRTLSAGPLPRDWRDDVEWKRIREHVHSWSDALAAQSRRRADLAQRWKSDLYRAELIELEPLFQRWSNAFILFAWIFLFSARRRLAALSATELPSNRQIAADLPRAREANDAESSIEDGHRALRRLLEGCGPTDTPEEVDTIVARGERLRDALRRAGLGESVNLDRAIALADVGLTDAERSRSAEKATCAIAAIDAYRSAAELVRGLLAVKEGALDLDELPLQTARTMLTSWRQRMEDYRAWCLYQSARDALIAEGGSVLAVAHAKGAVQGVQCERVLERAMLDAWVLATRDAKPVLREFDGTRHHALVARFQTADRGHIRNAKRQVAASLEARLPPRNADAAGEPGTLKRELAKKRNHMPLRKLLNAIPNLLPRLKPCLLMSPLSVAQYLPATGRRFDLVVFDEASQICTHDSIGAIGRGNQLVVVGDSKQLPPTAFFARAATDEAAVDENDFTELESILDEARASGMPEQMLAWHYRSRHETLIEFSNQHYYENRLNVFPAARTDVADLGVKFHLVEGGVYELGKSRTNPREAEALVQFLVKQLRKTSPEKRTFGVVTFSSVQQELIEDLLEEARRKAPEIEPHFADDHPSFEKVFVKNLENVQGDERDEILFSIAYGPDDQGRMLMNFGPINRDGGERRLNVAVTRARKQLRVFSSIRADQIDTNRTRATGARHLKAFLRFAAERDASNMARTEELAGDFDSDFERDVYDFLRASGYRVDTQVGCGGYRIDMAVAHPQAKGVYALGIECDGAAYHSGATARDRDRLRQQVLEGLGWRLHRIWSSDWIYRRTAEGERLIKAIEHASRQSSVESTPPVTALDPPSAPPIAAATPPATKSPVVPYARAELKPVSEDPDTIYEANQTATLKRLVGVVLAVEAPIHLDELTRRVGDAYSLQRIGAKSRRRVQEVVNTMSDFTFREEFIWRRSAAATLDMPVREGKDRDVETVPPEEVASAARWVLMQALSIPMNDLLRETARTFGIQRRGAKVEERMRLGIELLLNSQLCSLDGERVVWRG